MIGIGIQMGGPELKESLIRSALVGVANEVVKNRQRDFDDGKNAWINPIFLVPGSLSRPDFDGLKLGYFSRKKKGLVIQISVPPEVVAGIGIKDFIFGSLRDSVLLAADFFKQNEIAFSALKAEKILLAVQRTFD